MLAIFKYSKISRRYLTYNLNLSASDIKFHEYCVYK